MALRDRPARPADAAAIAVISNEGVEDPRWRDGVVVELLLREAAER